MSSPRSYVSLAIPLALLFSAVSCYCGGEPGRADAGVIIQDSGSPVDAGGTPTDAGPDSGTPPDAGRPDAGPPDAGPPDAGPPDAGPPDAGPPDAGKPMLDAGYVDCAGVACGGGNRCCLRPELDGGAAAECLSSCPVDAGVVSCDGPEDCSSGATNVCCGQLDLGAGSIPACPLTKVQTECRTSCPLVPTFSCPGPVQARLCHADPDCAGDPSVPLCCQLRSGTAQVGVCVSAFIKQGLPCLP